MAKEYIWETTIHARDCRISCEVQNNRYVLYVNNDFLTTIYRKTCQNQRGGIDEEIEILGEICRFVVWDEQPDIVIDGRLLSGKQNYAHLKGKRDRTQMILAYIQIAIALLGIVSFTVLCFVGENVGKWIATAVLSVFYLLYGLWNLKNCRSRI